MKRPTANADDGGVNSQYPITPTTYAAFAQLVRDAAIWWRDVRFVRQYRPRATTLAGADQADPGSIRLPTTVHTTRRAA